MGPLLTEGADMPPPNFGTEPELRRCSCGREHRWVWYSPRGRQARWCSPKVNPCSLCERPPEAVRAEELRHRLVVAGIPTHALDVRLDQEHVLAQRTHESAEELQARVRAAGAGAVGVLTVNVEALRTAYRFLGTSSPIRWLLLTGPPGTGKTTWMGGLARRLLEVGEDRWTSERPGPGGSTLARRSVRSVEYHRVDDLVDRERLKLRGLDPHPTVDVAKVPVLLLDELGLREKPTEAEARLVERIVMYRSDHGLPTVIATNLEREKLLDEKRPHYGARVASRLRSVPHAQLGGPDWRAM